MFMYRNSRCRQIAALVVVLALISAACGGSGSESDTSTDQTTTVATATTVAPTTTVGTTDDSSETTSATTESTEPLEPLTASARGVTETEIHIGVSMLDFDALKQFNLVEEGWGDQIQVYDAFIDEINARGGIHGRMIVPHYEHYSPLGSTEAEAACIALTQDVETFAVLGGFLGPAEVVNTCIVDINETVLIGGVQTAERLSVARAPWVSGPAQASRSLRAFLTVLQQSGRMEDRSVAVIGAIEREEVYDGAGDLLAEFGVDPVLKAFNDAPAGDVPATDARWEVLAENIRAVGADTILLIGSTQGGLRGIKAGGLDVEVWAAESTGLENLGQETTADDAEGAITSLALTDQQQWDHESTVECREIARSAISELPAKGPEAHADGEERWYKGVHLYCRNVRIFEMLMTAAGRNPDQESFYAAIDGLGEVSLPGMPFASVGSGKPDFNDTFQLAQFDSSQGEAGALVSITDLFDVTP